MTIKGAKTVLNNPKSLILDGATKYSVSNHSPNKEKKIISARNVITFKASKFFKDKINQKN